MLCAKASGAILHQASEHEADHGQVDPGLFTGWEHFIVFREPTPGAEPGKRSLDHPAARKDTKAFRTNDVPIDFDPWRNQDPAPAAPRMFHDLDLPAKRCLDPLTEAFLLVSAIGPDQRQTREASSQRSQLLLAPTSVLDLGFLHQYVQDHPSGVDEQMPLAPFDFLAAIEAADPPFCVVFTD